ncbi:Bud-site selection protein [Rickenella mellea]|uniref:Bud-site selection protein n=1 Tax=Rickenella mellea TaxID=50990 RepID=A0A4Y7PR67_9AGAM|nr:Bud-site selection protein [Rickenella mellea]
MSVQGEKRGVKRKRGPFKPEDDDLVGKLSNKLHHVFKEVKKASRKAKSFETQKLVKKLKGLRSDGKSDESKSNEAQLEFLKLVDAERIAVVAFRSKLHKDRLLRDNSDIKQAVEKELSTFTAPIPAGATLEAKVESRLLSSKVLAQEISDALLALRSVLSVKEGGDVEDENGVDVAIDSKVSVRTLPEEDPTPLGEGKVKAAVQTKDDNAGIVGDVEIDDPPDADLAGWESGSVHSDAKADIGDVDDGWESGSIDTGNHRQSIRDESDDESVNISQENSDSDPDEPSTYRKIQKGNPSQTSGAPRKSKASESTFLPSLSVGFIKGDSDASDWSDGEGDVADSNAKKNRRGQRARKAIWEKKYGKNANHLKKQREEMEVSGRGFGRGGVRGRGRGRGAGGMGRGAASGRAAFQTQADGHHNWPLDATGRGRGRGIPPPGRFSVPTGSNAIISQTRSQPRSTDEKPLHPSWEAKRRLKEKQSAAIVPPQGTRLKF